MVGTWAVSFVLGGLRIPALLDFTGLGMTTPLAVLTPLGVAIAVSASLPRRADAPHEVGSARPLAVLDALLVLACVLGIGLLVWGTTAVTGWDLSDVVARNAAGYVGLALLTRAVISAEVAPLVPVGLCVLSLVMGNRPGGRPHLWAWPIELDLAPWATVAAVVAFGAGLASVTLGDGGLLRAVRRAVAGGYPQTSRSFSASDTPVS